MTIQDLLQLTISRKASDLHLISGYAPTIRVDGDLIAIESPILDGPTINTLVSPLLTSSQKESLEANAELDFGYSFGDGRFRINAYMEKGKLAVALRLIPLSIKGIEELSLPSICHNLSQLKQGFVLVTGPTGQGKSTTIAAIINEINLKYGGHILTIEDPIEYIYAPGKALVSQREISLDTHSWLSALRSALREDPNVVLVGEMRDYETIAAALTIAETGHLVFATLHTNSAAQSIDRIVGVFPENQQEQVKLQLSGSLEAVISQRLVPGLSGGRVPAAEILLASPAVRSIIREGKTHLIDNVIQTSAEFGMMTLDMSLAKMVALGKISFDVASAYAANPDDLRTLVKKG